MRRLFCSTVVVIATITATASAAQDWQALTQTDLEAAAALIRENHPAMAPEIGDTAFVARFDASLAKARKRLDKVTDADGMAATLRGFGAGLGDDHIAWESTRGGLPAKDWAGVLVVRRGPDLRVTLTEDGAPPLNARLIDCDGVEAAELLRRRTADRVPDPDIEAQLLINSFWTLIDDGNPFIERPKICRFDIGGRTLETTLAWRPLTKENIGRISSARRVTGRAGFGLRQVGDAWWIGLQSLGEKAPAVLEAAKARQAELRSASLVVVDLRGNGGGNSAYGDDLAEILMGPKPLKQLRAEATPSCRSVWRASPDNRKTLDAYAKAFPDNAEVFQAEAKRMDEALAEGRALTGPVANCQISDRDGPPPPHPLFKGKLVVITDAACFSSCPLVVQTLRNLGAVQVGAATNAPTRYMEVRGIDLPSGTGRFTTMQKAAMSAPPMIGPYAPDIPFPGDITDTAALEAWIPTAVKGR